MAAETWLRLVVYRPERPDDEQALAYMKSSIRQALQMFEKQPGFQLGYWGRNPADGTMAAVTYWNSREAIEAAGPTFASLQEERKQRGIAVESVRNIRLFAVPVGAVWEDQAKALAAED